MNIARREALETRYWLRLIAEDGMLPKRRLQPDSRSGRDHADPGDNRQEVAPKRLIQWWLFAASHFEF